MYKVVFTWILVFLGLLGHQARGDLTGSHRSPPLESHLTPVIEGSLDCPNPVASPTLGGFHVADTSLIRPLLVGKSRAELAIFAADLALMERIVDDKVMNAIQTNDLPRFEEIHNPILPLDVMGGRYVPARDLLYMNETLVRAYFSRWFSIFASSRDLIATPTDKNKQLRICFGYYSGRNAFTIVDKQTGTDFYVARGMDDFVKNTLPHTLDYLWEYTVLSHELGHILLALHQRSRPGAMGLPDKIEELRADCISGFMMGTLLSGEMADTRRERITRGFSEHARAAGIYSHGTWEERGKAAQAGYIHASMRQHQKSRIVLTSGEIVNYCVGKYPGPESDLTQIGLGPIKR